MPGDDGSDDERQALEDKHTGKIATALRAIMRRVAPPGTTVDNITPDIAIRRYREASTLLRDALVAMLTDGVLLGAQVGGKQVEYLLGVRKASATIVGVDWDLINQDALAWVLHNPSQLGQGFGNGYANAVLAAMNTTSENQLNTLIGEWIRNGLTYNSLISQMTQTVFSRQRAEMVATTEIGRSFFEGSQAAWRRSGVVQRMRWNTANDEIVARCPVCWPRHRTVTDIGGTWDGATIPGHPRCRCYATPVVDVPDRVEPQPQPGADIPLPKIIGEADPRTIDAIAGEFRKLASEYPELTKWVKSFDFSHRVNGFEYDIDDQSFRMSSSYAKLDPNQISNLMKSSQTVGDEGFYSTVIHELGHALDRNITVRFRSMSDLQDDYLSEIKSLKNRFGAVSQYGETNLREWVAEKFTAERLGIHDQNDVQIIFKKYIPILHEYNLADIDFKKVPW